MIILEKPFVSDILADAVERLHIPVLENGTAKAAGQGRDFNMLGEEDFIKAFKDAEHPRIYSNSEDSIAWMEEHLAFSSLPGKIDLCKDKVRFRRMLEEEYPGFFFAEVPYEALDHFDPAPLTKPFIIKPAVGFFSIGVYKVSSDEEWPGILGSIRRDVEKVKGIYPGQVLGLDKWIIEENIGGDEFAIDLYYDEEGEPVILNILHHLFASESDMSDRTYVTSKDIIEKYSPIFHEHLVKFGKLAGLRNLPMHLEYRVDGTRVVPIEANPMRFAAWCTTDIAHYAWGINTVEHFFRRERPDWESIFRGREDKVFSLVVAFVPPDVAIDEVRGIGYDRFLDNFSRVLSVRKIDFRKYHVFAFVFTETNAENRFEIDKMLRADLHEYVIL